MTRRNTQVTGAGLRWVAVYRRDPDDSGILVPAGQTQDEGWGGYQVSGAQALTITLPESQRLPASGDDIVYHIFTLPPTEGTTGELRVSKDDLEVQAYIANLLVFGSEPWVGIMLATDRQGYEADLILHGQQIGINSDRKSQYFGQRIYRNYVLLNTRAQHRPPGMEAGQVNTVLYSLAVNQATIDGFMQPLAISTHGCETSAIMHFNTLGRLRLEAFIGNGVATVYKLSTTENMRTSGHTEAYIDGVRDFDITVDEVAKTVTFTTEPADGTKVVIAYELAD